MAVTARNSCAGLSDPGRRRENNEDRFHADPERGIFFVVDGVGGQAAGEKAADTAWEFLKARLERPTGTIPVRIREAIALANNEIHRLAQANEEWHGMACVLTVAVLEENELTIGQVGDSRLYLIQPGEIRKLTHDHSPVGEREDRGEIDEVTAMRHPRRNEVYRDVGTTPHTPEDADFIEIVAATVPPDGVLLLCSDGLSDLITSRQILSIVEAYAGNPDMAARALIEAANEAGGKDNITVVLVESPRFAPGVRRRLSSPRTSTPLAPIRQNLFASRAAFLLYGLLVALSAGVFLKPHWRATETGQEFGWGAVREPRTWRVTSDISAAVANALPGDTIVVAPGIYNEQIRLKDGIRLISEKPREAILRSSGVAISGEDIRSARIEGFRIQPDDAVSLQTGIQLTDSAVEIVDNEISGTLAAGVELATSGNSSVRANNFYPSSRAAIVIGGEGNGPRVVANQLTAAGHAAIIITGNSHPFFGNNVIRAADPVFAPPHLDPKELLMDNTVILPQELTRKPPARLNAPSRVR
ncbi:MAG: protein phosphatase 2C domain-containing protein [Bryobacteraceae bacterium]|nr:protein phosphatase 2C domain-containing protein [Bryobacteraceae bacterium]